MTIRGGAGAIDRRSPPPHKTGSFRRPLSCKKVSFFLYKRAALPYLAEKGKNVRESAKSVRLKGWIVSENYLSCTLQVININL